MHKERGGAVGDTKNGAGGEAMYDETEKAGGEAKRSAIGRCEHLRFS